MPATAAGHPPASVLAAFALGKLDGPAAETVHAHLTGCPACRTVVETTPNDSLMALVRQAAAGAGRTPSPARPGAATRGTLPVPNPDFDEAELPPELRDHPRYRILRKLGQGGMGAVYQAEHRLMKRTVAVKVIAPALVDSPDAVERFQREVQAAARLEHPNIVRAYDADRAGTAMLLAMEFVPGRTLADVVAAKGPLPVAYACQCIRQAAHGLQHAADRGMVHRDIKPHNLMLSEKGVVKILDFGLAKLASERASRPGLTGQGMVMGTPEYMAPEQARDTAAADVRADIYALGCTLFHLLTGRPPFRGATAIDVLTKHLMDPPPAVTELRPDVPAELAALVSRMLAKEPAERPQTPREVAEALAPFTKAAPKAVTLPRIPAPPVDRDPFAGLTAERSRPIVRRPLRRRWPMPAVAVVTGLLFGIAVLFGGVLRITTKHGTIVLENLPADAQVTVDGEKVSLSTADGKTFTISVSPGKKHQLQVQKDGFTTFGKEVEIAPGASQRIAVWLELAAAGPIPAAPQADPSVAADLAPDKSEWAGLRVERSGAVWWKPRAAAVTVTDRHGQSFTALVRADAEKFVIEGTIGDRGELKHRVKNSISPSKDISLENVTGGGEVRNDRMMLTFDKPNTSGAVRFELKRLPDKGGRFTFAGTWTCVEGRNGRGGVRTVRGNGTFTDWDGKQGTWWRDGGMLHVGNQWLAIDPDNPNQLSGGHYTFSTTWIRTEPAEAPKDAAATPAADAKLAAPTLPPPPSPTPAAGGFMPLFNGKDGAGWKRSLISRGSIRVEEGILIVTGNKLGSASYASDASYADFHLRAEVQYTRRNSFIAVRSAEARRSGADFTSGYFVSCGGETVQNRYVPPGSFAVEKDVPAGTQAAWQEPVKPVSVKPDQWYWIDVIARANTITVLVEGQEVKKYEDKQAPLKFGSIRLVSAGTLRVRKLEIKTPP